MKNKKLVKVLSSLLAASVIFTGCSSTKNNQPSSADPTPTNNSSESKPTTEPEKNELSGSITFSAWDVDTQMPYIKDMLAEFMSQHPGVNVEIVDIPSADYDTKLNIDLNGGAAADVILVKNASTMPSMNQKGQLVDLNEYIKRDNVDLSSYNGLDKSISINGTQPGLPFRTDYYVLYYNKDIFDTAGVAYPSNDMTWADFEELAKKVTFGEGANKVYGAHLHTWQALVENWAIQDGKNTTMGPDYEFMKPYYEMALRMQNDDKTIMDYATLKTANIHYSGVFQNGSVAMLPMGTWFMATMRDVVSKGECSVNWGVATIPHPEGLEAGNTVGSATPISINAASKNKELAWELIKFMTGDSGASYLASVGQLPARINPELLDTVTSLEGMPEGAKEALQVKNIVLDRPIVDNVNEVDKMLGEEHSLIMLGEVTIDEGIKAFTENSKTIQEQ
ncbi:ABC transporter substrate-binding protein [Lachnoclostridium phytofermentans]|uniref:Extracellular solute-binding protein family 1 n=1 Tax=Lachnoclostridium phytofermentans (strain ATCC 700394 / DSM 18823 / ISDg) TaxID=357809 RepID=A9KS47_LACP7|nr:sugar ABC transporter substrate-binding protein [Lachnoclostridium phytofermentans]ABX40678.1 extracellular solute-binding protein family 1 [Lachnoclostridium phytofermentans ISDg]